VPFYNGATGIVRREIGGDALSDSAIPTDDQDILLRNHVRVILTPSPMGGDTWVKKRTPCQSFHSEHFCARSITIYDQYCMRG
jgi:hypothetical protein